MSVNRPVSFYNGSEVIAFGVINSSATEMTIFEPQKEGRVVGIVKLGSIWGPEYLSWEGAAMIHPDNVTKILAEIGRVHPSRGGMRAAPTAVTATEQQAPAPAQMVSVIKVMGGVALCVAVHVWLAAQGHISAGTALCAIGAALAVVAFRPMEVTHTETGSRTGYTENDS